jgi:hypothetical protein
MEGSPVITKPPKIYFSEWQVAALVTITIIIGLGSTSPRTAFYSMTIIAVAFFLVNGVFTLVSRLMEDIDR